MAPRLTSKLYAYMHDMTRPRQGNSAWSRDFTDRRLTGHADPCLSLTASTIRNRNCCLRRLSPPLVGSRCEIIPNARIEGHGCFLFPSSLDGCDRQGDLSCRLPRRNHDLAWYAIEGVIGPTQSAATH